MLFSKTHLWPPVCILYCLPLQVTPCYSMLFSKIHLWPPVCILYCLPLQVTPSCSSFRKPTYDHRYAACHNRYDLAIAMAPALHQWIKLWNIWVQPTTTAMTWRLPWPPPCTNDGIMLSNIWAQPATTAMTWRLSWPPPAPCINELRCQTYEQERASREWLLPPASLTLLYF